MESRRPESIAALPPPITPQTVTRTELHNGVVVLTREQPGSGLVVLQGYVKAGAMYDGERSGLARAVTDLLARGTATRSSQEIADALEGMGAALSFRLDLEWIGVTLRALREDFHQALTILSDVLMMPTFPPEEVEKARGEILTSIRVGMQDTRHVAERTFRSHMFPPGHPHARVPDGEEPVVASLTREELLAFHRAHVRPEATLLAIVGDITAADALGAAGVLFSGWSRRGLWALPPTPPVGPPVEPVRAEVRLSGKVQSDLVLGSLGVSRTDAAYYETMMANLILGQMGLMGRLGDSVRERQGMAYYAYSDLRAGLMAGPWWVRAGVNPKNEEAAIASIVDEIRAFNDEGPEESELIDARDYLIGSMAVRLETNAGIAQTLADIELFDLGLDYLERYPSIIRAIRGDAIRRAVTRLSPDAYYAAIAGPPT